MLYCDWLFGIINLSYLVQPMRLKYIWAFIVNNVAFFLKIATIYSADTERCSIHLLVCFDFSTQSTQEGILFYPKSDIQSEDSKQLE